MFSWKKSRWTTVFKHFPNVDLPFSRQVYNEHTSKYLFRLSASARRYQEWHRTSLLPSSSVAPPTPRPPQKHTNETQCTCSENTSWTRIPVPSLPIRTLPCNLILGRHCSEMTSFTFDLKNQNPSTLLYQDTIWQYLPWSKCTRNTHSENRM